MTELKKRPKKLERDPFMQRIKEWNSDELVSQEITKLVHNEPCKYTLQTLCEALQDIGPTYQISGIAQDLTTELGTLGSMPDFTLAPETFEGAEKVD